MMATAYPLIKDVVLIGGGHSHALLLRAWGMRPVAGARLTVINPAPSAPYTGMLPGHVAGHYPREALEIDLVRLAGHAGARLIQGLVEDMDIKAQRLKVSGRPDIPYDIASLDIGITSNMPEIPGFETFGVSAKPLGPYAERWRAFVDAKMRGGIVVLGGGVGGVELALAMQHRLQSEGQDSQVTVIDGDKALSGVSKSARVLLLKELETAGIDLRDGVCATEVTAEDVRLDDGTEIDASLVVGAAGARPFEWLEWTGLDLTDGFVTVDATLRSVTSPAVYAAGDCAHLSHAPRPKAGVFAVRAAPVLAHNIRADLIGGARRRFRPQSRYLKLISLGRKAALTDKWSISLAGDWVWNWKDRIDRKFMDRLSNLPPMQAPPPKEAVKAPNETMTKPLCGGCGAKVGGAELDRAIARHVRETSTDNASGPGDDAAVLTVGNARQVITTDHLRAFWDDPYLMARIAAVHALGDVWAMGSAPQAMLPQIILPRMEARLQDNWLDEIMAGASEIASAAGARIVGGHTSMGAELTLGFTVTGLLSDQPRTLGGAQEGDAILLTRPIGSGTLLAGDMAGKAKGRDVVEALALMATPQGDAAAIVALLAHAMTDVTGFGLAGHLSRMAKASRLTASVSLADVPIFDGAEDLSRQGVRSSLFESNRADVIAQVPDTPRGALLFDPQTAGGFLVAMPEEQAKVCLERLADLGHSACLIGRFEPPSSVEIKAG